MTLRPKITQRLGATTAYQAVADGMWARLDEGKAGSRPLSNGGLAVGETRERQRPHCEKEQLLEEVKKLCED